ncbi:MAG: sensor histidine kinase [Thermomicrobiales bacterium]
MSIRTRLAVAVALVLVVTLVLLGVVLVRSTRASLVDQVDDNIYTTAVRAKGEKPKSHDYRPPYNGDSEDGTAEDDASYAQRQVALFAYTEEGVNFIDEPCGFKDNPKPEPRLPPIPSPEADAMVGEIVTVPSEDDSLEYRAIMLRGNNGTYVVAASTLESVEEAVDRLVQTLLLGGALILAAATLASWWLIRRGLRPVDQMVDTAAAIAAGDLSRRVPEANSHTELGRLGGALNEMLSQIEQSVQERAANEQRLRRFVADAAHELRTPLTSVRGYAELYRQGAIRDTTAIDNAMGRIEAEGARMARLVDDLLLLARLDRQRGLEREPVEIMDVVREAIADFRAVEPDRPLTERLDGEAVVLGDRIRLRQIVDNLLSNVRTHTPGATPVHVTARREADRFALVVADEGPGIAPEDQERVFERFWRADPSRVRRTGGTGLGLAIVASLVQAHGGTVDVASEPGRGAIFTVWLPLAAGR